MGSNRRLPLAGTAASVLGVLIAAVGVAWALNQSSYMVFQFNPYLVGAGICAVVAVAALILPFWRISRGLTIVAGLVGGVLLVLLGLLTMPDEPVDVIPSPDDGNLRVLLSRDNAFLDPSHVLTVQRLDGLGSREWYLGCVNDSGVHQIAWVDETHIRVDYAEVVGPPGSSTEFTIGPRTGEPDTSMTCSSARHGSRPGIRSPR